MNELSEFRRLRADAPLPDADRLAAPRTRLVAALGHQTRHGRAALPNRRMVPGAATAGPLALTAGIVATLPDDTTRASAGEGPRVLSAGASADALRPRRRSSRRAPGPTPAGAGP
jgi:hypothetical protein